MGVVFARVTQPCQPSPVPRPDRPAHRPFRGLLSVHSRCGLHTRTVTVCRDRYPKASDTSSPPCLLRSLPAGAVAGWGLHPLEKRRLVTAHVDGQPFSCLRKLFDRWLPRACACRCGHVVFVIRSEPSAIGSASASCGPTSPMNRGAKHALHSTCILKLSVNIGSLARLG